MFLKPANQLPPSSTGSTKNLFVYLLSCRAAIDSGPAFGSEVAAATRLCTCLRNRGLPGWPSLASHPV